LALQPRGLDIFNLENSNPTMPTHYTITTPLGRFATVKQASEAHRCDRATLMRRIQTEPDQYQRQARVTTPARTKKSEWAIRGVRWPISWAQYRLQDWPTRDEIWQQWLRHHQLDPDAESTADLFFAEMDSYTGEAVRDEADEDCALDETPTA
jgi:hypothetical protein